MRIYTFASLSLLSAVGCAVQTEAPTESVSEADSTTTLDRQVKKIIAAHALTGRPAAGVVAPPPAKVELGKALFFDKILGGERNMACASCHHPRTATGDGLRLSRGVGASGVGTARLGKDSNGNFLGSLVPRRAPATWNANLWQNQFWDGRIDAVDLTNMAKGFKTPSGVRMDVDSGVAAQSIFPITSEAEMRGKAFPGMSMVEVQTALAARVAAIPAYVSMFRAAFGDETVTIGRMGEAVGAYEASQIVVDTPWSQYIRTGGRASLSRAAKRGAVVFYEKAKCGSCHSGDLGTDLSYHNIAMPQFGPGKGDGADTHDDFGRERVTHLASDRYKFRTPTMINVATHKPYGHDGAYATLSGVIRHHLDPVAALAAYHNDSGSLEPEFVATLRPTEPLLAARTLDPLVGTPIALSSEEMADLIAFLDSQTDPKAKDFANRGFVPPNVPSGLPVDQ
ncbi:MAG: hypothetical protein NVS3B20_10090 [Polyangiales bacterium]